MHRLLLLRHAATELTGVRLSGWTPGISLNDEGRAQARALARRLEPVRIDALYSSPLERCVETAEEVAGARGLQVRVLADLGEVRYGDWTGRELKELAKEQLWRVVQLHPSQARFPGGESLYEMQVRAVAAVERLRADHRGQTVAVASHADVIKAVTAHYLGLHLDQFQRLVVGPASLTAIAFQPIPHLLRLNETGDETDLIPPSPPDGQAGAPPAGTTRTGAQAERQEVARGDP
ncbi:MAG TPA: MSMEG_4193 family putative phosphomutase [Actinomycetes bacterium]|nr:MSMEG_4193 family putative phosphomutase [Actinomycetes bacterium]